MRPLVLLREAATAARAAVVPSILVVLVVAGTCLAALLTVGRQVAAEAELAEQLAGPAARTLTITVTADVAGITAPMVALLAGMTGTETVVATELPRDAVNGALGAGSTPIAVVGLFGTIEGAISLVQGRLPAPGEVIVPELALATLGLAAPVGFLETAAGEQWAIVGSFTPREPFSELATVAITTARVAPEDLRGGASFHQLRVVSDAANHVSAVQRGTLAIVDADPQTIQVTPATAGGSSGQQLTGTLSGFGRSLLLLILGAGAFFVAAVVLADVLIRRRDLGRRRTLGITRAALVSLVAVRTVLAAMLGAMLGAGGGLWLVARATSEVPLSFASAVALLATLTALVACLLPALFAAHRDPVEVMRTP